MRSTSRIAGVSINTVTKLLEDVGAVCSALHDDMVRGVNAKRVQCDEIWSFCYAKAKNVNTAKTAPDEAGDVWTWTALEADSKLILSWLAGGRDSPAECIGTQKHRVEGDPDPKHVSTSYVERQNLTMRMAMRRFTRLTNGFSKKLENHVHALALYFMHYNWMRQHKSLNKWTPAMAAGLTDRIWTWEDILVIADKAEAEAIQAKRLALLEMPQSN